MQPAYASEAAQDAEAPRSQPEVFNTSERSLRILLKNAYIRGWENKEEPYTEREINKIRASYKDIISEYIILRKYEKDNYIQKNSSIFNLSPNAEINLFFMNTSAEVKMAYLNANKKRKIIKNKKSAHEHADAYAN